MENSKAKKVGSCNSSSSFTTDLFGPKVSSSSISPSSSSSGIFGSVFDPPSNSKLKRGEGKDNEPNGNNSNCASRGNWWQGSLYY